MELKEFIKTALTEIVSAVMRMVIIYDNTLTSEYITKQ